MAMIFASRAKVVVCWFLNIQHVSVSQGRICSDNFTCCHTEIEVADPAFHLTQSQHTDTGPTTPSTDPIMPGAWQGSHCSAIFEVTGMTRPHKNPGTSRIQTRDLADTLTTRPTGWGSIPAGAGIFPGQVIPVT